MTARPGAATLSVGDREGEREMEITDLRAGGRPRCCRGEPGRKPLVVQQLPKETSDGGAHCPT
jgi:hypothetical protein